jgi:hypothetical protein
MPKKQKSDNGLADTPQLMPIGKKSGKGTGLQRYFQSNAAKAGLAGVVVLLLVLVLIVGWQLIFGGGSGTKSSSAAAGPSTSSSQSQSAPAPPTMPADTATESTDQQSTTPAQNGQNTQENKSATKSETQPEASQPEQPQPGGGGHGNDQEAAPGTGTPPAQLKLPDDISKWEGADFIRARQDNSPKLLEAVAYLGEKYPGSVPMAKQLADLLKTPRPSDPSAAPSAQNAVPGLIEAVINALGKNDSQPARKTLMQILNGKLTTDDDKTAVEAVLKTLVQTPSTENDETISKVIVSPEQFRPATPQGAWQPSELRSRALELIKQNPSESLNVKLAEMLMQKGFESNDPALEYLLQNNLLNLNAQLHLYQSEDLSADAKTRLEQYFLERSSQAIGMMSGIPLAVDGSGTTTSGAEWDKIMSGGRGKSAPSGSDATNAGSAADAAKSKISDYERGAYLAKLLWGEPLAGLMFERVSEVRSLEKSAPEIVLASTLPLDSIHSAVYKALKKRWSAEGLPQALDAGWNDNTNKTMSDPGLIVVIKMLLQGRSKMMKSISLAEGTTGGGTSGAARSGRYSTRRPSGADTSGSYAETAQKKEQIELDWIKFLSKLTQTWQDRFDAAAQAQRKAARRGLTVLEQPPTRLDEFDPQDVKSLKDLKPAAAYQLNWPSKAPGGLGKVKLAGLKIQYFRFELTGMPKKTMLAIRQAAKGGDVHDMSNGQWMETFKNGAQPASKRSLDIMVTSVDKQQIDLSQKIEESIDLQVDILAVEITDPLSIKE